MELGLYEQVVNDLLDKQLNTLPTGITSIVANIDKTEATTILAAYIPKQEKSMLTQASNKVLEAWVALANKMLSVFEKSPKLLDNLSMLVKTSRSYNGSLATLALWTHVDLCFDCPLDLHRSYSCDLALTAIDYRNVSAMQQGACWHPGQQIDILLNTLNKAEKTTPPLSCTRTTQSPATCSTDRAGPGQERRHPRAIATSIMPSAEAAW